MGLKFTTFKEAKAAILSLAGKIGINIEPSKYLKEANQQYALLEFAAGKPMQLANPSTTGVIAALSAGKKKESPELESAKRDAAITALKFEAQELKQTISKLQSQV